MSESAQTRTERGRQLVAKERNQPRCRSCNAPVTWVVTTGAKRMPVDPTPVPGGNIRLTGRCVGYAPQVEYVEASSLFADTTDEDRYVSHFATCPNADEWRNRKGSAR